MKKNIFLLCCTSILLTVSCANQFESVSYQKELKKNKNLTKSQLKNWLHKDLIKDTIPGISLERVYSELIRNKKGKEVIVAVIDTKVKTNHEDLSGVFWKNENEIPNNGIDDDNNGYIDDINGWNFLGNSKGDNILYASNESVRIIQKFQDKFKNVKESNVSIKDLETYKLYKKAKKNYKTVYNDAIAEQKYADFLIDGYPKAMKVIDSIYPNKNYIVKDLDSLVKLYKKSNLKLAKKIYFMADCIKYDLTEKWIKDTKESADNMLNYTYNLNYYDKIKIDSFPHDITKTNYGNNLISDPEGIFYHSTYVSGIIAANSSNSIGINGVSNNVKIMPLVIAAKGRGEYDKDIALAIKYAVDNGAKVINMSFGKKYSLYKEWVFKALKYAENHNVLVVCASGNDGVNLNVSNEHYPNDNVNNGKEFTDIFLLVGSISHKLDSTFVSSFSRYGSIDVDLFAPGEDIYTTTSSDKKYNSSNGTSWSCAVTSGVAALIRSYYPKLTAVQVKEILMKSGVSYDLEVIVPGTKDKKVKFNTLSKSGKVLNAYNALLMAREYN